MKIVYDLYRFINGWFDQLCVFLYTELNVSVHAHSVEMHR